MDSDVDNFDLSDDDKAKAKAVLEEAHELETKKVVKKEITKGNEYYFDEIHNDDEAKAFIKDFNSKHNIKGRIPSTHETIVMRLNAIYHDNKKK